MKFIFAVFTVSLLFAGHTKATDLLSKIEPQDLDLTKNTHPDACALPNNLIRNGCFEDPQVTTGWQLFDNTQMPGWTTWWNFGNPCIGENMRSLLEVQTDGTYGVESPQGKQFIELDTDCDGPGSGNTGLGRTTVTIEQKIPTNEDKKYHLSFTTRARPQVHSPQILSVMIDAKVIYLATPPDSWTTYHYVFKASSNTTTVTFSDTGAPDTYGVLLDNVSVH